MDTKQQHCHRFRSTVGITIVLFLLASLVVALAQQANAPVSDGLTGNWVVRTPNADGTFRLTYFNLKQEGSRITGSIRVTQFYYLITESSGGPEGFTIIGAMKDGKTDRRVQYEGLHGRGENETTVARRDDQRHVSLPNQPSLLPLCDQRRQQILPRRTLAAGKTFPHRRLERIGQC